ncbi:CUB and sushi domain-containing protein 1, partial [Caerostris extrusa]
KESCPDPGISGDGTRDGECCFIGSVLEYGCDEEYELVGEDTIECLPGSNWNSPRPFCKPKSVHCDPPPRMPHGVAVGNKEGDYYRPYEEVEIHCELGYRYSGDIDFVMCLENGTWKEDFGECTGYELIGSFERYCKQNGQWSGELAICDHPNYSKRGLGSERRVLDEEELEELPNLGHGRQPCISKQSASVTE